MTEPLHLPSHLTVVQGGRSDGVCRRTPDALRPDGCDRPPVASHGFCQDCFLDYQLMVAVRRDWLLSVSVQFAGALASGPSGASVDHGRRAHAGELAANVALLALEDDGDDALADWLLDFESDRESRAAMQSRLAMVRP